MHRNGGKGGRVSPSCGSAHSMWWEVVGAACKLAQCIDDREEGEEVRERRTRRTRSGGEEEEAGKAGKGKEETETRDGI